MARLARVSRAAALLAFAWALSGGAGASQQEGAAPSTPPASGAPSGETRAGAVITGRVTPVEGEAKGEIVVYLEATDAAVRFAPPAGVPKVSQKGAKFEPSLLVVCVGQTVEFLNDEERPIEHNVFSRSETKEFDLGVYKPGGSKSVTFDKCGPVKLFCSIHRYMDGAVYVAPSPFFAIVDAEGRYRIEGVAPGEYHVKTWQRKQRYDEASARVTVADGDAQPIVVDLKLDR